MMNIGRKLYYDKLTGEILVDTGEKQGNVRNTTYEEDIAIYKILAEKNEDSFDYMQLDFGEYGQDFLECTSFKLDIDTKDLVFNYGDNEINTMYQTSLSEEIENLKEQSELQQMIIDELLIEIIPSLLGGGV